MPCFDAQPIPPKKLSGTEITSAHGQEITRNISALRIHSSQLPSTRDGITASRTARATTTGVYTLAKRVTSASRRDLLFAECSTSSSIFDTVDSLYVLLTLMRRTPLRLTQPDTTC